MILLIVLRDFGFPSDLARPRRLRRIIRDPNAGKVHYIYIYIQLYT